MTTAVHSPAMAPTGLEHAHPRGSIASGASMDGSSDGIPAEIDLQVILPDGSTKYMVVDSSKQMMDLLVQVAASNKLSPAGHALQIFNEDSGQCIDYKASQTIGALRVSSVHLVNKKAEKSRRASQPGMKPFEVTQRLTVNLPRNQRFVTRVNPKDTLAVIFKMICQSKNVDPYKHELRHPTNPDEALNMASPLEAYHINEIYVVPLAVLAESVDPVMSGGGNYGAVESSAAADGTSDQSVEVTELHKESASCQENTRTVSHDSDNDVPQETVVTDTAVSTTAEVHAVNTDTAVCTEPVVCAVNSDAAGNAVDQEETEGNDETVPPEDHKKDDNNIYDQTQPPENNDKDDNNINTQTQPPENDKKDDNNINVQTRPPEDYKKDNICQKNVECKPDVSDTPDGDESVNVSSNGKPADLEDTMPRRKSEGEPRSDPMPSYMPGMDGETKKKKGFFGLFSRKKSNKFKPQEASYMGGVQPNMSASKSMSTLPQQPPKAKPLAASSTSDLSKREEPRAESHPAAPVASNPRKPPRKKRMAPAPPLPQSAPPPPISAKLKVETDTTHSRNSSHSSGFDESNMSPLESPGNSSHDSMKTAKTKMSNDCTSVESEVDHGVVAAAAAAPSVKDTLSDAGSSASGGTSTLKHKKRRAPAPPPPGGASSPVEPEPSPAQPEPMPADPVPAESEIHIVPPPISSNHYSDDEHSVDMELPPPPPELLEQPPEGANVNNQYHDDGAMTSETDGPAAVINELQKGSMTQSDQPQNMRPATFIAPPPPDSPPPPYPNAVLSAVEVSDSSVQVHASLRTGSLTSELSLSEVHDAFDQALDSEEGAGQDVKDVDASEIATFNEQMTQMTRSADSVVTEDEEKKDLATEKTTHHHDTSDSDSDSDVSSSGHYEVNMVDDQEDLSLVMPESASEVVLTKKTVYEDYAPPKRVINPTHSERYDEPVITPYSSSSSELAPKRKVTPLVTDTVDVSHRVSLSTYDPNLPVNEEIMIDQTEVVYVNPNDADAKDSFYEDSPVKREDFALPDYRISKMVTEETVDYQFGGPGRITSKTQPKMAEPSGEQVSNLRQIYRKPQRSHEQQYKAELNIVESKIDSGSSSIYKMLRRDTLTDEEPVKSMPMSSLNVVEEISLDNDSNVDHVEFESKHLKDSINTYSSYLNNNNNDKLISNLERKNSHGKEPERRGSREESDIGSNRKSSLTSGRSYGSRTISEPSRDDVTKALTQYNAHQRNENMREETRRLTSLTGPQGFNAKPQRNHDNYAHRPAGEADSILEEKSLTLMTRPAESKSMRQSMEPVSSKERLSMSHHNLADVGTEKKGVHRQSSLRSTSIPHLEANSEPLVQVTPNMQEESKRSLQRQYDELQRQFNRWQQQLLENQQLLARKNIVSHKEDVKLQSMAAPSSEPHSATHVEYSSTRSDNIPAPPPPPPTLQNGPPAAKPPRRELSNDRVTHKPPLGKKPDARYEKPKGTYSSLLFDSGDLLSAKSKLRQCKSESDTPPKANGYAVISDAESPREGSPVSLEQERRPSAGSHRKARLTSDSVLEARRKELQAKAKSRFEPQLDPREELMIAIRNAAGRNALRKVPAKKTQWYYKGPSSNS